MYGWIKSEAQLLNWLRSQFRRVWNTHPSKLTLLEQKRFLKANNTGRRIYHCRCEKCGKDFKMTDIEVNHKVTVGKLTVENLGEFVANMLIVKPDDLELLCKSCHGVVTYSERMGISIEDAEIEKRVIKFKNTSAEQQKAALIKVGIEPGKTIGIRMAQAREYMKSKRENQNV